MKVTNRERIGSAKPKSSASWSIASRIMRFFCWTPLGRSPLGTKARKESRAIRLRKLSASIFHVSIRERRLKANGRRNKFASCTKNDKLLNGAGLKCGCQLLQLFYLYKRITVRWAARVLSTALPAPTTSLPDLCLAGFKRGVTPDDLARLFDGNAGPMRLEEIDERSNHDCDNHGNHYERAVGHQGD